MLVDFWLNYHTMIVTAVIGTLGYGMLINAKADKLVYGCIGGAICIIAYCICVEAGLSLLMQNLVPAAAATLYSELMARFVKAPATVFLLPSVIPLVPGGKLYYAMRAMVDGNDVEAGDLGVQTATIAVGLAIGIVLVSLIFYHTSHKRVQVRVRFDTVGTEDSRRKV